MEWINELREEKLYNQITEDNEYIDFEELEKLVLPEDFDVPRRRSNDIQKEDLQWTM